MDEIERVFLEEVAEKKKAARGIHNKATRKKLRGKVLTPVDFLKGRERKAYMGNSEVKISSIYDSIIPYDTFKSLPDEEKTKYLLRWLDNGLSTGNIAENWGRSKSVVQYWKGRLNLSGSRPQITKENTCNVVHAVRKNFTIILSDDEISGSELSDKILTIANSINKERIYKVEFRLTELSSKQ